MATPRSIAYLNGLWITGYVPTQSDYEDLFVSFPNLIDNNQLIGIQTGITAHAGGGQGSATQLTNRFNSVDTVATALDSVKLPAGATSQVVVVRNSAANAVNVYPQSGAFISRYGVDAPLTLPQYCIAVFTCTDGTNWQVTVSQEFASATNPALIGTSGASITLQANLNNNFRYGPLTENVTFPNPTGTMGDGQVINLSLIDDGTPRTLSWGSQFESTFATLPTTTNASNYLQLSFQWNATSSKWQCLSVQYQGIALLGPKKYIAQIFATGTSAPTATVFENTLSGTPVWSWSSTGVVTMSLTGQLGTIGYSVACTADINGTAEIIEADSEDAPDAIHFQMTTHLAAPTNSGIFTMILYVYNS